MRSALPKNKTAPFILFGLLGVLIVIVFGSFHRNRLAQYSFELQCEADDAFAGNAAALINQELENKQQALRILAAEIAGADISDRGTILPMLKAFAADPSYVGLFYVGTDGEGYDFTGQAKEVSGEEYFQASLHGLAYTSDQISYDDNGVPFLLEAVPVTEGMEVKGVLAAMICAELSDIPALDQEISEGGSIYLLNAGNEPVAYIKGMDIAGFSYEALSSEGAFNRTGTNQAEGQLIWSQQPFGRNNWTLLYGKKYTASPAAGDIMVLTDRMWAVITGLAILMLLIMILIQRNANRKVARALYLDPVTGGDNWYKFRLSVDKILNSKQFSRKKFALVNFDINRFQMINDAYGYQKGDEVLKEIYQIIKKWAGYGEPVTRYAADQFYIMMTYLDEYELTERINELNELLHQPLYTKTARIYYGVYYIKERQGSVDRMAEFASIAMNNGKGSSGSILSFFDDAAKNRLLEEEEIEKSMNDALNNEEFLVYLQPQYTTKEAKISGAEALVRWKNGSGKPLPPSYFIPVFEKNGFITELDYYMLKKVCELIRGWLDKGYTPLPVSVNISRLHFANAHLAEIITDIVDGYGIPHSLIELELTESAFLQNKQMLIDTVICLREQGFAISMDDFGAGYSSLNSLKDLPLDVVKLDGELFRMTDEVERGLTVIRNTINMAKDLHIKVVAECIETREQVEFLRKVGCDVIQGYYFARPMPAEQFEETYIVGV